MSEASKADKKPGQSKGRFVVILVISAVLTFSATLAALLVFTSWEISTALAIATPMTLIMLVCVAIYHFDRKLTIGEIVGLVLIWIFSIWSG